MKTILKKEVLGIILHKYENVLPGKRQIHINGMIWMNADFNIIIRKGKFFLQHKDGKAHGVISRGTTAHRRISRIVSIYFRTYRKDLNVEYFQSVCDRVLIPYREKIRAKLIGGLETGKFYEISLN